MIMIQLNIFINYIQIMIMKIPHQY